MFNQRRLAPEKDTFFIQGRIVQPQMDKVFIKSAPAFSIFPVNHCEQWEPRVADDRDPFPPEGSDCGNRFIHPLRPGFDTPVRRSLCDHDRHLVAFPGLTQDDLDLVTCGPPNDCRGFAIRSELQLGMGPWIIICTKDIEVNTIPAEPVEIAICHAMVIHIFSQSMVPIQAAGSKVKAQELPGVVQGCARFKRRVFRIGVPEGFHLNGEGLRLFCLDRLSGQHDASSDR